MALIDGNTPLLDDATMREIGFTDHREGVWYFCRRVGPDVTVNFTIDKATGDYSELVMDENFGQPFYYGRTHLCEQVKTSVEEWVAYLNSKGLTVDVNHSLYGAG